MKEHINSIKESFYISIDMIMTIGVMFFIGGFVTTRTFQQVTELNKYHYLYEILHNPIKIPLFFIASGISLIIIGYLGIALIVTCFILFSYLRTLYLSKILKKTIIIPIEKNELNDIAEYGWNFSVDTIKNRIISQKAYKYEKIFLKIEVKNTEEVPTGYNRMKKINKYINRNRTEKNESGFDWKIGEKSEKWNNERMQKYYEKKNKKILQSSQEKKKL